MLVYVYCMLIGQRGWNSVIVTLLLYNAASKHWFQITPSAHDRRWARFHFPLILYSAVFPSPLGIGGIRHRDSCLTYPMMQQSENEHDQADGDVGFLSALRNAGHTVFCVSVRRILFTSECDVSHSADSGRLALSF